MCIILYIMVKRSEFNLKKLISSIISFIMLFLFCILSVPAYADTVTPPKYVALGDSISFGMSATNNAGYTTMFSNHLKSLQQYTNLNFVNASQPGYSTSDLLQQINNPSVQAELSKANIITISIGGNNLLAPFIATIATAFSVNPTSPTLLDELAVKIVSNPAAAQVILGKLQNPNDPLAQGLNAGLQNGVTKFASEWPVIIASIRALSPNSKIYVNSLYNPFPTSDPLYSQYKTIINSINSGINAGSATLKYNVVDVATIFSSYTGAVPPVNFSFVNATIAASVYAQNPTSPQGQAAFKSIPTFLDPHPNDIGHQLIYKALIPVTSVSLDKTSQDLILGSTLKVTSSVLPVEATYPDVVWTSSNEVVATVDGQGLITAKASGKATITVTTKDGNKTSSLEINVIVPVNSITLDKTSLTLYINDTSSLKTTISPADASNTNLIWKSSNEEVVTVDEQGLVTAKATGKATITVTTVDGNKTSFIEINVIVPVKSITLDKTSLTLYVNDTSSLKTTISPTNATNKNLIWKSSNEAVVTVDGQGLIKAKALGKATITVTTEDGNKTSSIDINVIVPVNNIILGKPTVISQPITQTTTSTLPKSGSMIDLFFIVTLGCILMGVGFILIKRTNIKET